MKCSGKYCLSFNENVIHLPAVIEDILKQRFQQAAIPESHVIENVQ